jgi:basic amino acid/polyamine antiporter, APA family
LHAAGMLYFAFIGFDALATFAEELKNPQRDLPRGILGTLVVTSVLYVLFAAVLTGAISYRQLAPQNGIVDAYQTMFPPWLARTLAIGTLIGLFGTVFAFLFSQSRVLFSLARDGLVPRRLANVHPRYRTPTFGTAIGASLAILAVLLLPLGRLTELLGIGTLFAFTIVCASVLKLRYESPDAHRPFKVWFFPWLPMAGIALNFMLAVSLGLITWARFFGWMLLGVAVYFLFGRHHSRYANDPHA